MLKSPPSKNKQTPSPWRWCSLHPSTDSFWRADLSDYIYGISSIHFATQHKHAPTKGQRFTGNYFSSRWPNPKGHLGPSQLTTGPFAAFHTVDHFLCETLRPLILMRPDLEMPWRSLVFFSRLSSLHAIHFPPEWVIPKVLALTTDFKSGHPVYTSSLNKPMI